MKSHIPLDYAVFQLSPKRSRCELFVSCDGQIEKLTSGLVKPFVTHLRVAEEQFALAVNSIKLDVEKQGSAAMWFTKGTLERFVRFVSTPEILELVNTYDAEMSQLESARRIYSQVAGDQCSGSLAGDGTAALEADATKNELLRAIDVRLAALKQDLTTAYARAAAAGFNSVSVSELQLFADRFGGHRLNEGCSRFLLLCQKRPELGNTWISGIIDCSVWSSFGSDMSIDNSPEDHWSHQQRKIDDPVTKSSSSTVVTIPQIGKDVNKIEGSIEKQVKEEMATVQSTPQTGQSSRRLSVQDRINMFENKQKEGSGGAGGKTVVLKSVELRRLSSDASFIPAVNVEKAVLRRWSTASDMSIDLGSDKKDTDSPLCTPSFSISQAKSGSFSSASDDKDPKNLTDMEISSRLEVRSELKNQPDSVRERELLSKSNTKVASIHGMTGDEDFANQSTPKTQLKLFANIVDSVALTNKTSSQKRAEASLGHQECIQDRAVFDMKFRGISDEPKSFGVKNQAVPQQVPPNVLLNKARESQSRDQMVAAQSHCRMSTNTFVDPPSNFVDSSMPPKDSLVAGVCKDVNSSGGEIDNRGRKKDLVSFKYQPDSFVKKVEDYGIQRMKSQKHGSGSEQMELSQGRMEDNNSFRGNSKFVFPSKIVSENQETDGSMMVPPGEQVQRGRNVKGNQERNGELKLKANELEKLFAHHQLRIPSDQTLSNWTNKPTDLQIDQVTTPQYKIPAEKSSPSHCHDENILDEPTGSCSNIEKISGGSLSGLVVNHQDDGNTPKQKKSNHSFSDDSRGKFYDKYMRKRDDKMREEWSSNREEKEAKMKAMHDSLERSRAEMVEKFSGSADRQDSLLSARKRAEKLRSFNIRSTMKMEQPLEFPQSEEDDDLPSEVLEQTIYGREVLSSVTSLGDGTSRSTQHKKSTLGTILSSSSPRIRALPISRSSVKASNSGHGRRRAQLENPLLLSVPNFSDLRKENAKPLSGSSKVASRSQMRNFPRSKSTSEDVSAAKDDNPQQSQLLKKSYSSHVEFRDLSTLSSDGAVSTPLKYDRQQTEQNVDNKFLKTVESKSFLRKGNGISPGSGAGIAKLRASVVSEAVLKDVESANLSIKPENFTEAINEDEDEQFETSIVEISANIYNEKERVGEEFNSLVHSESENGHAAAISVSQADDPGSISELPASVPPAFHILESVQNSPGESPVSWNSRMHNTFSYPNETSDIDVSADSPLGSPTSWNSRSLSQSEADAARMRKKWGSTHRPVIAASTSHNQSRKDVTKGFKRLLKFGRKNRGTETLADWISATTSEGDDDTEDGRDLVDRSSEDLRKSRMGLSHGHSSEDGRFNRAKLFNEHVHALNSSIPTPPANFKLRGDLSGSSLKAPRSFFSLSTFRSKASDSKLR